MQERQACILMDKNNVIGWTMDALKQQPITLASFLCAGQDEGLIRDCCRVQSQTGNVFRGGKLLPLLSVHFANICIPARGRLFEGLRQQGQCQSDIPTLLTHSLGTSSALHNAICASPKIQVIAPG